MAADDGRIQDVPLSADASEPDLTVYLVDKAAFLGPRPAVLVIHGGGWAIGDKSDLREVTTCEFLAQHGYVAVSANYRMNRFAGAPFTSRQVAKGWPGMIHDIYHALHLMKTRAPEWSIDSGKVALFGSSAGGHLALLAAYGTNDARLRGAVGKEELPAIRGVVSAYGVHDLRQFGAEQFTADAEKDKALLDFASPVTHLSPSSPPTLIIHGEEDTIIKKEVALDFAGQLEKAGVRHKLYIDPHRPHGFVILGNPEETEASALVMDFLQQAFSYRGSH